MELEVFKSLIEDWQKQEKDVLNKKASDYAGSDVLSNFRKTAFMCDLPVEKVFEVMMCIKMCRLVELSKGKAIKYESQEDTLLDSANYSKLYRAYLKEKGGQQNG